MGMSRGGEGVIWRFERFWLSLIFGSLLALLSFTGFANESDPGSDGSTLRKQRAEVIRSLNMNSRPPQTSSSPKPIINLPPSIHRASAKPSQTPPPPLSIETKTPSESLVTKTSKPVSTNLTHQVQKRRITQTHRTVPRKLKKQHRTTPKKTATVFHKPAARCGFCTHDGLVFCNGQSVTLASLIEQDRKQRRHSKNHRKKHGVKRTIHHRAAHHA
jgi:hypothetical protein